MAKIPIGPLESSRYSDEDTEGYPCVLCGRGVNESKAVWVFLCDGGLSITDDPDSERNDPGFMGAYPIGPSCHRKHRKVLKPFIKVAKGVAG